MDKYYRFNENVEGYSILKIIGEGKYGIVCLAQSDDSTKYIIKQLKESMLQKTKEKLFYEEDTLKNLNSPSFPKFIGKFKDEYREGYILEYIEGYVFEDILREYEYKFSKSEIYKIAEKLINLIEELHKNNIVHRDIRVPNVILKENGDLAIIDFGLARYIDNERYKKEIDYWYLGDFLIHLYYTAYEGNDDIERPWHEELDLTIKEKYFLKTLMGIDNIYNSLEDIRQDLKILIEENI